MFNLHLVDVGEIPVWPQDRWARRLLQEDSSSRTQSSYTGLDGAAHGVSSVRIHYDAATESAAPVHQDVPGLLETIEALLPPRSVQFAIKGHGNFMHFVVLFHFDPDVNVVVVVVAVAGHPEADSVIVFTGFHDAL